MPLPDLPPSIGRGDIARLIDVIDDDDDALVNWLTAVYKAIPAGPRVGVQDTVWNEGGENAATVRAVHVHWPSDGIDVPAGHASIPLAVLNQVADRIVEHLDNDARGRLRDTLNPRPPLAEPRPATSGEELLAELLAHPAVPDGTTAEVVGDAPSTRPTVRLDVPYRSAVAERLQGRYTVVPPASGPDSVYVMRPTAEEASRRG